MLRTLRFVDRVAANKHPILILGETGVGKELIAERIFSSSGADMRKFVRLNCAAIPADLIEAELFGNEAGAFSGALKKREGLLEIADGGTLFLDEVTEMPIAAQAKLLRAIESGEFYRLGGRRPLKSDFRLISAMNRNPIEAVGRGKLREDLLYRLAVITIHIPPLRERPGDVDVLSEHFVRRYSTVDEMKINPSDAVRLRGHSWPGNVRELRNRIIAAICSSENEYLDFSDWDALGSSIQAARPDDSVNLGNSEAKLIERALEIHSGSRSKAAEALGISESTLYRRLRKSK